MSFTILEPGNTMRTKQMDDLRVAALTALLGDTIPEPVVRYLQAIEADLLERDHRRRIEFARSSWDQFITQEKTK